MSDVHLHRPQTLYRHWEDEQWSPVAIDLARDREQWTEMSGGDRGLVHWALSSLMVAEERITTKFAGLVLAHGSEEAATFLATQQVDEALSPPCSTRGSSRRTSGSSPSPASRPPRSFVTTCHLVIESTLGLTAFRFITRYLEREGLLPGFVEGYSQIHHHEQRHIGYGVWYLREAVTREPALADEVRATLGRLLPAVADSLTPPDREATDWDALGASSQEIREFALGGLNRRLGIIGVTLS